MNTLLKGRTDEEVEEKPINPTLAKLKQNKVFFYGFPVLVVLILFSGLFFFILPTFQYYWQSREVNKVLAQNEANVDTSIKNLQKALSEEPTIRSYDNALNFYIPKDPKLGDVLNLIQAKAKDFNLESKVGVSRGPSRTSVGNLAKKDQDQKALFQSISSGEITFKPKSLDKDISAVLMSIEVTVKGDKRAFLDFLNETKSLRPLINLVFIEYSETTSNTNPTVTALLRFESYALKLDEAKLGVEQIKKYAKDDASLQSPLIVENFNWDRSVSDKVSEEELLEGQQ
jgi:hypothetical protein